MSIIPGCAARRDGAAGGAPQDGAAITAVEQLPANSPELPPARAIDTFVDSLLSLMTLDEKLGQLTLQVGQWTDVGPRVREGGLEEINTGGVGMLYGIYGAEYTRELQRAAVEGSRLGIPLLFAHDVIHGFRTTFPVPLAEAASWDPAAVERASRIAALESSAHGLHWTFGPMVDIARDPRWGRIVEGAGEDPYLGSAMAAARVRGFQGDDLASPGTVMATAKHFVAYGAAEGGRDYNTAEVSERTLREIYLPPFRAAVDAGVGSVMASFNDVDGVPMHANARLIQGLLRGEWGWDGILLSDYTGISELMAHGIAAAPADAGVQALEAGVDVDIVSGIYRGLAKEVRAGRLAEQTVDAAVRRVLRAKYRLGLFDDPYRYSDSERERTLTLTAEHVAAARELAQKSIVLLKNEERAGIPVLPLRRDLGRLAVIGALADDVRAPLGSWIAAGRPDDAVSVLAGIRRAVGPGTRMEYARGADVVGSDTSGFAAAVRLASAADAVVLVLGEGHDMSAEARNRSSLDLPGVQQQLLEAVHATGTPLVVVLMNGRPLSIPWLDDHVPAILVTWYLGVQMGHAVADVLFGDYNPGGKLPVTFPRNVGQVPIYYNHRPTGRPPSEDERYTSKYIDVPWTPRYPFGHGISYTRFVFGLPRLSSERLGIADSLIVQVDVTNAGARAGDEVVQLYTRTEVASVTRPVRELRGFRRIHLTPGERRTVSFVLHADDLAHYDRAMRRVVEPGRIHVYVGSSSEQVQSVHFELAAADIGDEPDSGGVSASSRPAGFTRAQEVAARARPGLTVSRRSRIDPP
ncbi:MAG TPA: glycoside hydrolase family 3 N-terminal domain-containing protein [Longimicrobiales bacterium]|nr:glycoside hydrolase family 3 N-terminal domain-containing protein [Longimicrobiales bacterium]